MYLESYSIFYVVLLVRLILKLLQRKMHFISLTNWHYLFQYLESKMKLRYYVSCTGDFAWKSMASGQWHYTK